MKRRSKREIGADLTSGRPTLAVAFAPGGEMVPLKVTDIPWDGMPPMTAERRKRFAEARKRIFGMLRPAKAALRKRAK